MDVLLVSKTVTFGHWCCANCSNIRPRAKNGLVRCSAFRTQRRRAQKQRAESYYEFEYSHHILVSIWFSANLRTGQYYRFCFKALGDFNEKLVSVLYPLSTAETSVAQLADRLRARTDVWSTAPSWPDSHPSMSRSPGRSPDGETKYWCV